MADRVLTISSSRASASKALPSSPRRHRYTVKQLERGKTPDDRLQGLEHIAYTVRVKNRDAGRGKSGGYCVIHYVKTRNQVILITIYSKADQSAIPVDVLRRYIAEYEAQRPTD